MLLDPADLLLTPDERGHLYRQVMAECGKRAKRRKIIDQTVTAQLIDLFRLTEIFEAVTPQIPKTQLSRQAIFEQRVHRFAYQDLIAISDRKKARDPFSGGPK
jgi:hypothetical protein